MSTTFAKPLIHHLIMIYASRYDANFMASMQHSFYWIWCALADI